MPPPALDGACQAIHFGIPCHLAAARWSGGLGRVEALAIDARPTCEALRRSVVGPPLAARELPLPPGDYAHTATHRSVSLALHLVRGAPVDGGANAAD
jgi:hypothetical protein